MCGGEFKWIPAQTRLQIPRNINVLQTHVIQQVSRNGKRIKAVSKLQKEFRHQCKRTYCLVKHSLRTKLPFEIRRRLSLRILFMHYLRQIMLI